MPPRGRGRPDRPICGIVGWAAAWTIIERCQNDERRDLLERLVREVGVKGAPAMAFAAGTLRCLADEQDVPVPPGALASFEVHFIERRCRELLEPYVGDPRCKRMRPLTARKAA